MPRSARLDIPNLLQHVMVRGIERRDIFFDDDDRRDLLQRLKALLEKMEVECLAWSLMTNHFHLLLRPTRTPLAGFMRRLLTGYAVTFNLRHNRSGHLFQNRYKSLVCDEDAYLLELVRYIHLNPLRAGLVQDLEALERFPWSGHAVLLGKTSLEGQATDGVLGYFGKKITTARRNYRAFITDGVPQGKRHDLVGGGKSLAPGADSRVVGDEAFVERLRSETALQERLLAHKPIDAIIAAMAEKHEVSLRAVMSRSRLPRVLDARAAVCHIAVEEGHSGAEIARRLGMTRSGVMMAKRRGEGLVDM
jgi:REP-associated tyrosine transposase